MLWTDMYQCERCFLQLQIPYVTCLRFGKLIVAGTACIASAVAAGSSCKRLWVRPCRIQPKAGRVISYLFCILFSGCHITDSELPCKTYTPSVSIGKLAEIDIAGIICSSCVCLYIYKRRRRLLIIRIVGALTYYRKYFKRSWEHSSAFSCRIEGKHTVYSRLHVCRDVGADVACI